MKIRYYSTRKAWPGSRARWGYWLPTKTMKAAGFQAVACGEDGPKAWAIAETWNARWDAHRRGERPRPAEADAPAKYATRIYPDGSLGEAFARFRGTQTWITGKKPRTKEDWWRGWSHIEGTFGDVAPATVSMEDLDGWYAALLATIGVRESHRAMKIWRALWRVAGTLKHNGVEYCNSDKDPSLGIRRKTPKARNAIWLEGEAVRLVKRAWRMGYKGLSAALAVAWDTMLSPVDVRSLKLSELSRDGKGELFSLPRAKTGKAAIGTLSKRTSRLVAAYIESQPFTLMPDTPIFHTRGGFGKPPSGYTRHSLGDDFRAVRAKEFPGDTRKVMDFRRSGAIEAAAGEVDPGALAGKMANTIDQSRDLQATYLPHNATLVRLADAARTRGRGRLRGTKGDGK